MMTKIVVGKTRQEDQWKSTKMFMIRVCDNNNRMRVGGGA